MHAKALLRTIGVPALAVALGFCAGSVCRNRIDYLKYGPEFESVRAEQQRVNDEYRELADNLARERELNNRVRTIIEGTTELLQSNDGTISGLRRLLSLLAEKIQELKNLFGGFDTGGPPGRRPGNDAVDG
jgi:hypothetical protein